MGKAAWVVVFTVMLLVSMVLAEEEPTIGQRLDDAVTDVTDAFNKHGGAAVVDAVSSTAKSVYNWFGDKAKELGIDF